MTKDTLTSKELEEEKLDFLSQNWSGGWIAQDGEDDDQDDDPFLENITL
jgi:hypothetical protein